MAGVTCFTVLACVWEPVQSALLSFLRSAVADLLSSLRQWVVTEARNRVFFWGNQVEQVPISSAYLVGMDEIRGYLQEIGGYLKDDGDDHVGDDQQQIFRDGSPRIPAGEQAKEVFTALSKRRFLLCLDDVWEKLDLKHVGIPQPSAENKSKIILTTRSKEVCRSMGATDKLVMVKALDEAESWKLFRKNVGAEVDLDSVHINPHARAVVKRCGGLPLALITVGRAMADACSRGEWQEAEENLRESPHELQGMEEEVLSLVRFSFDRLRDDVAQECLLYCCLFPEDYAIPVAQIIDYWVGEGLLDRAPSSSIIRARHRGEGVISKLKSACLLEKAERPGQLDEDNTFLVSAGVGKNFLLPAPERWRDAKRISLMCNEFKGLPRSLYVIGRGIFERMPALRVVDLSFTTIDGLPEEISFLSELRYLSLEDTYIKSLPKGLSKLEKLSQLNLDHTIHLEHVPQEVIPALTRLRVLGLFQSRYNILLPNEPSSSLYDHVSYDAASPPVSTSANMENNESCWDKLEELRITVVNPSSLDALLSFDRLRQCNMALQILPKKHSGMTAEHLSTAFRQLEKLQSLDVRDWSSCDLAIKFDSRSTWGSSSLEELRLDSIQEIVIPVGSCSFLSSLRKLDIISCHGIRDLSWVGQLPLLANMYVFGCRNIEELLPAVAGLESGGGDQKPPDHDGSPLPTLKKLHLADLPMLRSISRQPMLLPSLQCLSVAHCPMLRELSLGPASAKGVRAIRGEAEWWEGVEWHKDEKGHSVRDRFLPYFRSWHSIVQE
ncbi:hypothetical protein Taro_014833 [Colocasia esculenta]|uniref:NB-ARC domain-containing protein n=1 Tax=Colocasia esculenta TaxID=4460 RepID=A0A843UKB8_COLES|nr:hypothetical protein [Colocasia esculenta]